MQIELLGYRSVEQESERYKFLKMRVENGGYLILKNSKTR